MSLTAPLAASAAATTRPPAARLDRAGLAAALLSLDAVLIVGVVVVALLLRLPYLWLVPLFTDESREVLRAMELFSGGLSTADMLVNVDAYIGSFYLWLLAGIFWLTGVSALTPRLVMAVAGALAVGITYLLARDLGGRLAGLLAAALLATSGAQILSNGHIAWSHCLTPTLTTLATWMLQRAVRLDCRGSWLGSGFTFGLAFQTHPATLVLLAGRGRLRPLVGPALAADALAVPGAAAVRGGVQQPDRLQPDDERRHLPRGRHRPRPVRRGHRHGRADLLPDAPAARPHAAPVPRRRR